MTGMNRQRGASALPILGLVIFLLCTAGALLFIRAPLPPPPPPVVQQPVAPAPAHPERCEVEIAGVLVYPPGPRPPGQALVYVADNDCLADDAHVLGRAKVAAEGTFFIEVFARWGADLTVCAAHPESDGGEAALRGQAIGRFHAEAAGEVTFPGLKITLLRGASHKIPATAN